MRFKITRNNSAEREREEGETFWCLRIKEKYSRWYCCNAEVVWIAKVGRSTQIQKLFWKGLPWKCLVHFLWDVKTLNYLNIWIEIWHTCRSICSCIHLVGQFWADQSIIMASDKYCSLSLPNILKFFCWGGHLIKLGHQMSTRECK